MTYNSENLIWIDLEMTGLDTQTDHIIEIATIITDKYLNTLAEGPILAIHHPDLNFTDMGEWCQKQHKKSGLWERVEKSETTLEEAEKATLEFISQYVPPDISPMCGNSICQDRRFLAREMPSLEDYFHYRNLDVSTLKELAKRWYPQLVIKIAKENKHLALDDIKDSIAELRFYRDHLFKNFDDKNI